MWKLTCLGLTWLLFFGVLGLVTCSEDSAFWPEGARDDHNLYWFGTQSLRCMKGKGGISKRSAPATRSTLAYTHRILYFRGTVFEWGAGTRGYYVASRPFATDCHVTWERDPAGYSACSLQALSTFAHNYRNQFGPYNLITNNCHHFVNRLSRFLAAPSCTYDPALYDDSNAFTKMWLVWRLVVDTIRRKIDETSGTHQSESPIVQ